MMDFDGIETVKKRVAAQAGMLSAAQAPDSQRRGARQGGPLTAAEQQIPRAGERRKHDYDFCGPAGRPLRPPCRRACRLCRARPGRRVRGGLGRSQHPGGRAAAFELQGFHAKLLPGEARVTCGRSGAAEVLFYAAVIGLAQMAAAYPDHIQMQTEGYFRAGQEENLHERNA